MPILQIDPGGGGAWWKKKEPPQLTPMPVPQMPGPQMPGTPAGPPQAAPRTSAPWAEPGPEPVPWDLYQHGPPATEGQPEPGPSYAPPPPATQAPDLMGAMSQHVAPQLRPGPEEPRPPQYIPTDPSTVLHNTVTSPQYTQSVAELYMELSSRPGPAPTPHDVAAEIRRREGREVSAPLPPIDMDAPLAQLRNALTLGHLAQASDDLMSWLADWHTRRAERNREKGSMAAAVRQEQLAAAARGDVGRTSTGYLGAWMEQPGYITRSAFARYVKPLGNRFTSATPDELDQASTLLHKAADELEKEEAEEKLWRAPLVHLGGMLEAGFAPRRAEARWNPESLPVPRYPGEVRDFLTARYGDTPDVRYAAAWAEAMGFSGTERALAAAERILEGEDPYAVVMGHKVNTLNPDARDYEVYISFLQATEARGQDVEAAKQYIREHGYIPGETHSWRELAGSLWFDPTQIVSYGDLIGFIGPKASTRRAVQAWTEAANTAVDVQRMDPEAVRNWGRAIAVGLGEPLESIEAMAGLERGTIRAAEAASLLRDVGRTADAVEAAKPNSRLAELAHELTHPFELVPEARATQIREPATMLGTLMAPTVRNAEDAKILIKLMGDDPSQLAEMHFLDESIANSAAVANVKPVFAAVASNLDDAARFPSLQRQQFSLVDFVDDLATDIRRVSDELSGVTGVKGPDVLYADGVRNFMRDFWMTLNPGYVVRNMSGDLATMGHDGLFVMDSWGDVTAYLERVPAQSSRTLGLADSGPLAGMEGGLAQAPYIGGTVQQMRRFIQTGEIPFAQSRLAKVFGIDKVIGGPTIFGEEVRYTRAYYAAHQKAEALWWQQYRVPQQLQDTLGDAEAHRLWALLQTQMGDQESQLAIAEFVSGSRLRFGIESYMDDVGDLSPAMRADLNKRLANALAIEDIAESKAAMAAVFEDAMDDVRRFTDQTIATGATPPVRKVVSLQSTADDVKETTIGLGAMAQAMGVPDTDAIAGAEQMERVIREADSLAADAELSALRLAREQQLTEGASRAVIMDARTSIEAQRQSTRAAVDALRDQAWDDYHAHPSQGTQIWTRYRADATTAWEDLQEHARTTMQLVEDGVRRLATGEPLESVLPEYGVTMRSASDRYLQLYEQLAERDQALRLATGPELTDFYKDLSLHRLAEDTASDWAWRMAIENPSIDANDILYSAELDVTELARAARGRHDLARVKMETGELTYVDYLKAVDEAWGEYWTQAPHRWMQASAEIADAGGLTEALVPSAFRDVAKKAGIEIGDLAAIGRDGWQEIRDNAARMVRATQNEVMQQTGLRNVQWAGQMDTIMWPVDVDDVAYWAGYTDLSQMGPDDWRRVASMAEIEYRKWESMATEAGRASRVAAISGRQPEYGVGSMAEEMVTAGALSRAEERRLLQTFTRETRDYEARLADWILREAGFTAGDLADLNLQQRQKLLQELAQGDLLRQADGVTASTIGSVPGGRRETVIKGMPEPVKDLVQTHFSGTTQDPLQAVVERWARAAEQAEDWAEMLEGGVQPTRHNPQRFFHEGGMPVLKYDRDQIEELLEAARPMYDRRNELERVRAFAAQRYDAWSGVDFDDTTRMASTNWMAMDGGQVAAADRMHARQGMATAPRPADMALAAENQQAAALRRLRDTMDTGAWDDALDARTGKLTNDQINTIRKWYETEYRPMNNARALITSEAARDMADQALLDYSKRRNFDGMISQFVPYHYWYTRSARNWAMRFAARPQVARQYLSYKKWIARENEQRGYPSRLEGMVELPADFLPEWTGQRAFVDPFRYVWPFESLINPYAIEGLDEEGERGLIDTLYRGASVLGMEPFPHLKLILMLTGGIATDPEELYNFLPQTSVLQGVTSGLRELGVQQVPPGGFYIEAPVRRGLGLNEQEPASLYRIARQEVSMHMDALAQQQQVDPRITLMAMELVYAVERKELRLGEAMGLPGQWDVSQQPGMEVSEKVRLLAEKGRWTPEELHAAQQMFAQATQRAALERAVSTVPGFMGMPFYLYPPGEERARASQTELRAQQYSPLLQQGSMQQRQDYLEAHPEARLRGMTYGFLPGVEAPEFGPQQTINLLDYNVQKEQIEQQYIEQIEEYIRRNPWDSAGASALRHERTQALAQARAQIMGPSDEYDEAALWSVYGATPEERAKRRREQVLSVVSASLPAFEAYIDPQTGEVDYGAWEKAQADYYKDLIEQLTDHPLIAQLAQEAGATDIEAFARETLGPITEKDVQAYRRRNDTPLEAAQRTYGELYSMAWEAYNKAVEGGEDKGRAYRTYIEGLPALTGGALIQAIRKEYPGRWSEQELREELATVQFPSGADTHMLRKPQVEQELDKARSEFYDWIRWHVPPGQYEYDMRDAIPLLNAIKDWDTRQALEESGFTAEQWRVALEQIKQYMEENPPPQGPLAWQPEPQPGPENIADALAGVRSGTSHGQEYAFARGMNSIFLRFREQQYPGIGDLLAFRAENWAGPYLTTEERAGRDAFDAQHPELAAYRQWEAAFAQEHPVWAQYYKPWLLEEEEGDGDGAGAADAGEAKAAGRRASGGGGGRAGSGRISRWSDFAGLVDTDDLTALFGFWGRGTGLPAEVRERLMKLHERYGWGEFDEWLAWVRQLYQDAFASQARDVPRAQQTHWLPGMWRST